MLLLHLQDFIQFLEYIQDKKQNSQFSHIEENLWNALHCPATLTEFAVLALYGQAVSHPYMCEIRSASEKKINMLDLGPLHKKVYFHIQRIIGDPTFLIGPNASYQSTVGQTQRHAQQFHRTWDVTGRTHFQTTYPEFL